jgi:sporulation protein YlmC with PRC-barrel domain
MSQKNSKEQSIETELYEMSLPGKMIGKPVIDKAAKMVGIVRSVKIKLPPGEIYLVIKALNLEFLVPSDEVEAVGGVVQLNKGLKELEMIDINDLVKLRNEVREEMDLLFTVEWKRSGNRT